MLVTCTNCAKTFEKNITAANDSKTNHFCTRSCSASYNNKYRSRKDRRPDFTCMHCNNTKKSSHNGQTFCDNICAHEYKTTLTFKSFEEGNVISHRLCKKYWISKDRRCHTCNLEEWQGEPIPLELDHINGDGTDNTIGNTRIICPNCHAQTHNYKSKKQR